MADPKSKITPLLRDESENEGCLTCFKVMIVATIFVLALYGVIVTPIRLKNLNSVKDELSNIQIINFTIINKTYNIYGEKIFSTFCQNAPSLMSCNSISQTNLTSGYCQDGYYCCEWMYKSRINCKQNQEFNNVKKYFYTSYTYIYNVELESSTIKNPLYFSFKSSKLDNSTYYMGFVIDGKYLSAEEFNNKKDDINKEIKNNINWLNLAIIWWSFIGFSIIVSLIATNYYKYAKKSNKQFIEIKI